MTILPFTTQSTSEPPSKGNGALEIVRDFFDNVYPVAAGCAAMHDGDHFLAWLANEGFAIVPLEDVT